MAKYRKKWSPDNVELLDPPIPELLGRRANECSFDLS